MPFSIPTTLEITDIVSNINKNITLSEEIVHQVNLTIPPSTTDEEILLEIRDLSRVKSLFLTVSAPITYNFSVGAGDDYPLNSAAMLLGGSAQAFQKIVTLTAGTLVVDQQYYIKTLVSGDSFTNVGASSDNDNISFVATGTNPTNWTNGSELATRSNELTSIFVTNPSTGTTVTFNAVIVTSND